MWFLFGFITLGFGCVSSFLWRRMAFWSGETALAGGARYEFRVSTRKRRATGVKVGVACAEGFTFSLRHEGEFDRWSKDVGLVRECQTGDVEFDRDFYVLSDDPVVHRMLQTDRQIRTGIRHVFDDCADRLGKPKAIYVHAGRIWIDAKPQSKDRDVVTDACRSVVAALNEVAGRLNSGGMALKDDRDPFPLRAACILAISTGLCINAAITLFRLLTNELPRLGDWSAPLPFALGIGVGLIVLLAFFALRTMGRSARTHLVLLELLLSGTFGASVSAYGELRDFNIDFDHAAPRPVQAQITERYTTHHSKGGTSYHLTLSGWPAGSYTEIQVSYDVYNQLSLGQVVVVAEHPGALRWVWASGFQGD